MATFDPVTQTITLRIVFDGLGMAGKTTNIRQVFEILSSSKRGDLYVPEERRGRTLYFDWLEIEAGLLDERRVRCQLLTVPGQFSYVQRRWHLLGSPDAIIAVVDSTPQGLVRARYALRFLQETIANHQPPVPLLLQANKQDLEGALPGREVGRLLGLPENTRIVEAAAIQGAGVRATLVFALQAARERTTKLIEARGIEAIPVGTETAEEVYHQLLRQETENSETNTGEILADQVLQQLERISQPPPPNAEAPPSGPPVSEPAPQTLPSSVFAPATQATAAASMPPAAASAQVTPAPEVSPPPQPTAQPNAIPEVSPTAPWLIWPAAAGRVDLQEALSGGDWQLHKVHHDEGEELIEQRSGAWALLHYPARRHKDRKQGALALRELAEARVAAGELIPSPWSLLLQPVGKEEARIHILRRVLEPAFTEHQTPEQNEALLEPLAQYTAKAVALAARHGVVLPLEPAKLAQGPHGLLSLLQPAPINRWGDEWVAPLARWLNHLPKDKYPNPWGVLLSVVESSTELQDRTRLDWPLVLERCR